MKVTKCQNIGVGFVSEKRTPQPYQSVYTDIAFCRPQYMEALIFFPEDSENAERSSRGSGGAGQVAGEVPTKVRNNKRRAEIH